MKIYNKMGIIFSIIPMQGFAYTGVLHFSDFKKRLNAKDPADKFSHIIFPHHTGAKEGFDNLNFDIEMKEQDNLNPEEFTDQIILKMDSKDPDLNKIVEKFENSGISTTLHYTVFFIALVLIILINRLRD